MRVHLESRKVKPIFIFKDEMLNISFSINIYSITGIVLLSLVKCESKKLYTNISMFLKLWNAEQVCALKNKISPHIGIYFLTSARRNGV